MVLKSASLSIGLPHSGHSGGVSGSVSSSMVLSTSTNGTSATMAANHSPARLATRPPPWRERVRVVDQGVEHADERPFGRDAGEQFAGAIGDRAHQHAAGAAA